LLNSLIFPSILMGLGIAIDVAIATISRFRDQTMDFRNWTAPVAASHIVLPAFGYYSWWILGANFVQFGLILGILAFSMISIFLYETFCDWIDASPLVSLSPITDLAIARFTSGSSSHLIVVLAVSMDALWSGPAKAAQAESGQWSSLEVVVSFFIAGAVVALVAELSLIVAKILNRISFKGTKALAVFLIGGKFLEATILFAFGLLSLWNAFSAWFGLGTLADCIIISATVMVALWVIYGRRLYQVEFAELKTL
jgi:hypothetical protein